MKLVRELTTVNFSTAHADSSDVEFQQIITVEQASRGLSAIAELLVKNILGK